MSSSSTFDYWQCVTAGSTTPTDSNNNYRRVRIFYVYNAAQQRKAYTDTGYNEYVKYPDDDDIGQLWQVKTLTQDGSAHNSTPTQNKYWTIGDRCGKSITSCMRRFQGMNDGNGGAHPSTTLQNRPLPFGAFPGSRQFR